MSDAVLPPNLVLTGFMGTGKSHVGRLAADRLARSFHDSDTEIIRRAGKSIPSIFAEDGEPEFRRLERAVVAELAARAGRVIAVGGGAILDPDNVAALSATGVLICLTASADTLWDRLRHDANRPLLAAPDPRRRLEELLAERKPAYDAVPLHVATDGRAPEDVTDQVLSLYREQGGGD